MKRKNFLKWSILLLFIVPILFGVVTYIQEMNQEKTYNATVEILLDNLNTSVYSNPDTVEKMLKSRKFLDSIELTNIEQVSDNLVVVKNNDWVTIGLKGSQKDEVNENLKLITEKFLKDSEKLYNTQIKLIDDTINDLKSNSNSTEKSLETQQFLYELQLKKINAQKAEIQEPITVTEISSNPLKRAIVSGVLGLALMIVIIIMGVIFVRRPYLSK